MSLCYNSLHICSWWSQPWTSVLGTPAVMALMCPSLDRSTWDRASSSQTRCMTRLHFHPPAVQLCGPPPLECGSGLGGDASILPQDQRTFHTQWGCLVLLKGMSCPARASPHPPHPCLRVLSCACMIACTWKLFTTRQKSCETHLAFIASSHKLTSTEKSAKSLIVV